MDRRAYIAGTLGLFVAPRGAPAQPANTLRRLGYVSFTDLPKLDASFNGVLRRLGWEEERNLVIERCNTRSGATLPAIAAELVRLALEQRRPVPNIKVCCWGSSTFPDLARCSGPREATRRGLTSRVATRSVSALGLRWTPRLHPEDPARGQR